MSLPIGPAPRRRRRMMIPAVLVATVVAVPVGRTGAAADGERAAAPADFATLTDDTGALTISVPSSWADIDTAPGTNDDGTVMPWISASTDFAAYRETFDVPGAVFFGVTYTTDLQSWIDRLGQPTTACADLLERAVRRRRVRRPRPRPSSSAAPRAKRHCWSSRRTPVTTRRAPMSCRSRRRHRPTRPCSSRSSPASTRSGSRARSTTTTPHRLPPRPRSPQQPSAPTPVTLPDGTPLVPATAPGQEGPPPSVATEPFTPSNSIAEGAVQITDDTRTITVAVPPDWAESATGSSLEGLPQILAGTQLAGFAPGGVTGQAFATPGVRFVARPFTPDTSGAVIAAAGALPCTPGTVQEYQDPVFTGHILQLTDCGGTATRVYLVEANPADAVVDRVAGHPGHGHRRQRPADRLVHVRCRPGGRRGRRADSHDDRRRPDHGDPAADRRAAHGRCGAVPDGGGPDARGGSDRGCSHRRSRCRRGRSR